MSERKRYSTGDFRCKGAVSKQVRVDDGIGGFTTSYADVGVLWFKPVPLGFRERLYEGQVEHTEDFDIVFRRTQSWSLLEQEADQLRVIIDSTEYRVGNVRAVDMRREYVQVRLTKYGAVAQVTPTPAPPTFTGLFDGSAPFDGSVAYNGGA